MSWHWIIDDPALGPMEKLVLVTIRRHQYGDAPVLLRQDAIAAKAGISLRAAQSALAAAEGKGCLEVMRRKNHPSSYRVTQKQGLMFSNANFHLSEKRSIAAVERGYRGSGDAPRVEKSVENWAKTGAAASSGCAADARGAPPGLFGTHQVRTFIRKDSGKTKEENPAAQTAAVDLPCSPNRGHGSPDQSRLSRHEKRLIARGRIREHVEHRKEEGDRRKVEARSQRLAKTLVKELSGMMPVMPAPPKTVDQLAAERDRQLAELHARYPEAILGAQS